MAGWLVAVRQDYPRHYIAMEGKSFDDWWQGFSSKTRSTLSRKARRLADQFEGGFSVRSYRTADEVAGLLAYLLSPEAAFFAGSVLVMDGGTEAALRPDDWPRPLGL